MPVPRRDVGGVPSVAASVARDEALSQPFPEQGQALPAYDPVRTATTPVSGGARLASTPMRVQRSEIATPTLAERARPAVQPFPEERQAERQQATPDPVTTGSGRPGWTTANAPSVMMRQGDTVASLSRRFGVPEKEILKANDLTSAGQAAPGQRLVIPVYGVAGSPAKAAASDRAAALDGRGNAPVPVPTEGREVAILPGQTQSREKGARAGETASGKLGDRGEGKPPEQADAVERAAVPTGRPQRTASLSPEKVAPLEKVAPAEKAASIEKAAPARVAAAPEGGGYVVKPGDSLNKIAKATGVPVEALKQANGLNSPAIRVGQTLVVPKGGKVATDEIRTASVPQKAETKAEPKQVAKADGKAPAEYTPPVARKSVTEAAQQDVAEASPKSTGISKYRWPVRGAVTAGYGTNVDGTRNEGINISVPEGTPVKAAENGVVIYSGSSLKELGNAVLVRHDDGTVTVYGNAATLNVQRGQKVQRGQTIASSGMTGKATQPQLHFEVRKNATPVNPATYLE
ncbi:peptidoglycan DD-metalloendopeptidase family protein [Ciceribacter sp. sgz301302]|uniref:peptidoglycan DD-metalloendopeptidase family protein n=1 Tax=Ciceribacter sp. sgz301302 TaxID=3342379 RepID=UPI0035B932E9